MANATLSRRSSKARTFEPYFAIRVEAWGDVVAYYPTEREALDSVWAKDGTIFRTRARFDGDCFRLAFSDRGPRSFVPRHTLDWPANVMASVECARCYHQYASRDDALAEAAKCNNGSDGDEWAVVVEVGTFDHEPIVNVEIGERVEDDESKIKIKRIPKRLGVMDVHDKFAVRLVEPTAAEIKRHATPVA